MKPNKPNMIIKDDKLYPKTYQDAVEMIRLKWPKKYNRWQEHQIAIGWLDEKETYMGFR